MARTLAALLPFKGLKIQNFSNKLKEAMNELSGINQNFSCTINDINNCQINSDAVFYPGSHCRIKWIETNIELLVFWDDVSEFNINGEECSYASLFVDVGTARNSLGYILAATIIIVLARETSKLIEDTSLFWVDKEILDVEKFVDRVKIENRDAGSEVSEIANSFYKRMNLG